MSGAEALWAAAAVAGAGTAADMAAQRNAAKERRGILNQSFADTQKATDKAAALTAQEGAEYAANRRQAAMDQQASTNLARELQDLQGANATGNGLTTSGEAGAVSGDFLRAKADKALSEGDRMSAIARELAKTRAPSQLVTNEAQRRAGVMEQTGSIFGKAKNMANAATLDAQSVEAPWWGTVGKLARTAALAYMGGAGSGVGAAGAGAGGAATVSGNGMAYMG